MFPRLELVYCELADTYLDESEALFFFFFCWSQRGHIFLCGCLDVVNDVGIMTLNAST